MKWPCLTRYTDDLPDGVGGRAIGPLVLIRPKYREDAGIHAHEAEHVRQWWMMTLPAGLIIGLVVLSSDIVPLIGLMPLVLVVYNVLYALNLAYREWCEATAYREQMRYPDRHGGYLSIDAAAERLALPMYRLDLTPDQARNILLRL